MLKSVEYEENLRRILEDDLITKLQQINCGVVNAIGVLEYLINLKDMVIEKKRECRITD